MSRAVSDLLTLRDLRIRLAWHRAGHGALRQCARITGSIGAVPSALDCLGHVRRVKAKPLRGRFASLNTAATAREMAAIEGTEEEQGTGQGLRRQRNQQVSDHIGRHLC